MNNYLSTLIHRHQQTPIIQPRLGSRFERAPGIGDFAGRMASDNILATPGPETPAAPLMSDTSAKPPVRFGQPALRRQQIQTPLVAEGDALGLPLSREVAQLTSTVQPVPSAKAQPDIAISQEARFQRIRRTVTPAVEQPPLPSVNLAENSNGRDVMRPAPQGAGLLEDLNSELPEVNRSRPISRATHQEQLPIQPVEQPERSVQVQPAVIGTQPGEKTAQPVASFDRLRSRDHTMEQTLAPSAAIAPDLSGFHNADWSTTGVILPETAPLPKSPLFTRPAEVAIAPRPSTLPGLPPAAKAEPPVIRVTIGRIEVRATMPPPIPPYTGGKGGRATPVSQPSTPKPALSLAEYLKQRGNSR